MHTTTRSWLLSSLLSVTALAVGCDAAIAARQQSAQQEAAANAQANAAVKSDAVIDVKAPEAKVEAAAVVKADVQVELKPESLDLETIVFLVKKGKIKDAATLEKKINNPKEKLNNVDIDGDGKIDKIQIVEVKKDDETIVFELHAIPSTTKDKDAAIVVAYVNFVPDKTTQVLVVKATYAPVVVGYETIVYDYTTPIIVKNDTIVVTGGVGFYGWLFAVNRPAYYGVFVYEYDPSPVVVVDVHHGGCWPPGHCKHHGHGGHGHHGHGKHKGKWK